jgi:hypothetical protein
MKIKLFELRISTGYEPGAPAKFNINFLSLSTSKKTRTYSPYPSNLIMTNFDGTTAAGSTESVYPAAYRHDNTKYHTKNGVMDKLTAINYPKWRNAFIVLLRSMNALRIVQGEESEPTPGNSATAKAASADFEKRSGQAASAILMSCSDAIAPYLEGMQDPHEMWNTLAERFDSTRNTIGRTTILRQFQNARPVNGEPIANYFGRLLNYKFQLEGTNEAISDSAIKTHIFTTLPDDFNITIQFLMLQPEQNLSINDVMDALRESDETRRLMRQSHSLRTVTDSNSSATSGDALFTERQAIFCSLCRKSGHLLENCWRRRQRTGPGQNNNRHRISKNITCYYCGEQGHIRNNCPTALRGEQARTRSYSKTSDQPRATASLAVGESDKLEAY